MEVIQVAATLGEICQADWGFNTACVSCLIILHFLSLLEGIMPCNFQKYILVRIVRLSAEDYSQWEVARMLCRKDSSAKFCGATEMLISHISGGLELSLTTGREDKQLIRMVIDNRFIPAARLCVEMIRQFLRRLSVQSMVNRLLAAGYRSRRPTRCPRLTSDHRRCHRLWGRKQRRWDLRHWRHGVFNDESRFTQFHRHAFNHSW